MKKMLFNPLDPQLMLETSRDLQKLATATEAMGTALSNTDRIKRRKMGSARMGYVKLIEPIGVNNINALPRSIDPAALTELMKTYDLLSEMQVNALKVLEMINDTRMAAGIDAIGLADSMVNALNDARKTDDALDFNLKPVDEYNSRFGRQMEAEDDDDDLTPATPATPANPDTVIS